MWRLNDRLAVKSLGMCFWPELRLPFACVQTKCLVGFRLTGWSSCGNFRYAHNKQLNELGISPVISTPEDLERYLKAEITKFAKIVRAAKIEPE